MRNKMTRTITMVKYELIGIMENGEQIQIEEHRKKGYNENKLIKECIKDHNVKACLVVKENTYTDTYQMDVNDFVLYAEKVNQHETGEIVDQTV